MREIIETLNERHLPTRKGPEFRRNSFSCLLKNRKYIGEYHYKNVIILGAVPPVIPKELFERVQKRMKKNQHAPARAKAERGIENMLNAIQQGLFTSSTVSGWRNWSSCVTM